MDVLRLLAGSLLLRPYVFIFLLVYLLLALPAWRWWRTLVYTVVGYGLAWAAEYSSIHNGFPFGPYTYNSAPTIRRELWVAGVPFFDSLSFVFLTFAGLQTARLVLEPLKKGAHFPDLRLAQPSRPPGWKVWALAGLLTMGMDVVIDPLALRGQQWFLGQIYHYPPGGIYFGVPLANFGGWALLSWVILGVFLLLDRYLLRSLLGGWRSVYADALTGALLLSGVLAFNLILTFAIGEFALGLAGCLVSGLLLAPVFARLSTRGVFARRVRKA